MFIFHALSYLIYFSYHLILYFLFLYLYTIISSMLLILCHIFFTFLLHNIFYISFAYTCHFLLCFMSANTLEADIGNNCLYPKVLYIPEGIICHTPIPALTRLADPNRVRGARTYTGTLYLIFFFQSRTCTCGYGPHLITIQNIIYKITK